MNLKVNSTGFSFIKPKSKLNIHPEQVVLKNKPAQHSVILIHGLMRTAKSMQGLGKYLCKQGYNVYLYGYSSSEHQIQDHSIKFLSDLDKLLEQISNKNNKNNKKLFGSVSIITHSLGGIIAREALSKLKSKNKGIIKNLIMLAPPNKGSKLARFMAKILPFWAKRVKPLSQLSDDPGAFVHQVAIPAGINIGIIAAKYDIKAPPAATGLNCKYDYFLVNAGHTFVMDNKKARQAILNYLSSGSFGIVTFFK